MAENFDLIFSQNASQQYAWSDNDYQKGWETIGNIPPTAAQFDALQRRNDTKMKKLNDNLTPLVNANTADTRQPATAYNEGDMKFSPLLPTGWFLSCVVAGTTSAGEIVLPSPVVENATVSDGTTVWKIRKVSSADGVGVGIILPFAGNGAIPSGYLLCDGSAVSRTMYPDLFAAIGTDYGSGDGSTTFNVPDSNQAKRFLQGDTVAGHAKSVGLPNAGGSVGILTTRFIIKAFDGQTADSALIDITQYANELAGKANRDFSNITSLAETVIKDAVIVDQLLAQNGYVVFSNGLILQWGIAVSGNVTPSTVNVTFPIAFPTYCLITVSSHSIDSLVTVHSYNKNSFTMWMEHGNVAGAYIAVGF